MRWSLSPLCRSLNKICLAMSKTCPAPFFFDKTWLPDLENGDISVLLLYVTLIMTILTVTGCGPSGLSPKAETTLVKRANVDGVLKNRKTPRYTKAKAAVESGTVYLRLGLESMWLGLEPSLNPECLVSGPNEAQVLGVSLQKEFSETQSDR